MNRTLVQGYVMDRGIDAFEIFLEKFSVVLVKKKIIAYWKKMFVLDFILILILFVLFLRSR